MKFQVYLDKLGFWRWRLKARNGRIIADSGESYINRKDCLRAIYRIKDLASTAKVI